MEFFFYSDRCHTTPRSTPAVRLWPRRIRSVWLAQEAEGSGRRLNKQINGNPLVRLALPRPLTTLNWRETVQMRPSKL